MEKTENNGLCINLTKHDAQNVEHHFVRNVFSSGYEYVLVATRFDIAENGTCKVPGARKHKFITGNPGIFYTCQ